MIHEVSDVFEYTVYAKDGAIGEVNDLLFDDANWSVRYLSIRTGDFMNQRLLLLAMQWVEHIDAEQRAFHLKATREELQNRSGQSEEHMVAEYKEESGTLNEVDEALEETFPASDPASTY